MFRFWSNESRGSGQTLVVETREPIHLDATRLPQQRTAHPTAAATIAPYGRVGLAQPPAAGPPTTNLTPTATATGTKRPRDEEDELHDAPPQAKRMKQDGDEGVAQGVLPTAEEVSFTSHLSDRRERAQDAIQFHFGLEILHRHDELRLIDQELAKCQVALEQLRRCHLIPYPVSCPTPEQMVEICSGKGPALLREGKEVPRWAAPFGVVDGPYARHYAKWLIPDPMFDGMLPDWHAPYQAASRSRARPSAEGRTTRNSLGDVPVKGRPVRGNAGQKLQALTGAGAAPREKGACILERKKDGVMVKLVCVDCHRGDFLSIQGFINHCRIAHRRDFKSHEDAAIYCGHPIDTSDAAAPQQQSGNEGKASANASAAPTSATAAAMAAPATPVVAPAPAPSFMPPTQPSGLVHPYARVDGTAQDAYVSLQSRIKEAIALYHKEKPSGVASLSGASKKKQNASFTPSSEAPYLSALMQSKNVEGNLQQLINDAKTDDDDDLMSPGYVDFDMMDFTASALLSQQAPMMRMPARTTIAPPAPAVSTRPASSKGPSAPMAAPSMLGYSQPSPSMIAEEDVDMESPNTVATSNVAPSLVSDDGDEYDDSDDGSSASGSDDDDKLDAESISDVTDLNMDDVVVDATRMRGCGPPAPATTVRLRKDDSKTVTLVSPVKNTTTATAKDRRLRNAEKL